MVGPPIVARSPSCCPRLHPQHKFQMDLSWLFSAASSTLFSPIMTAQDKRPEGTLSTLYPKSDGDGSLLGLSSVLFLSFPVEQAILRKAVQGLMGEFPLPYLIARDLPVTLIGHCHVAWAQVTG